MIPRVGVGVIVKKDGLVLVRRRIASHGTNSWEFVGGHLEFGESVEQCARREAKEEAGIELLDVLQGPTTNDIFSEDGKHYVTIFVIASTTDNAHNCEPQKCAELRWCKWDDLPQPLFRPIVNLRKTGFDPFD